MQVVLDELLYAVEDAQNAGFNVGEDLSVTDSRITSTPAEQVARQAQAEAFAGEARARAEQLEGADLEVSGQLTTTTADLGTVGFAPAASGNGIHLVDNEASKNPPRQGQVPDPTNPWGRS